MQSIVIRLVIAGLILGAGGLSIAVARDATPPAGHGHNGHTAASPTAGSVYAGRYDPAAPIRSLTPGEIDQVSRGEGAGFALPAELNGLPGPRHVLDLATRLGLSPGQEQEVQRIFDDMQRAVIPAGQRYLTALAALESDIRRGQVTEGTLPDRVAEVYRLEGELATAHLAAHMQTAEVLTAEQTALYQRLRGYDAAAPLPDGTSAPDDEHDAMGRVSPT